MKPLFYVILVATLYYVFYVFSKTTDCEKAGGVLVLTIADFVCVEPLRTE